ncbi:MAG: hypothetical protein PHQ09_05245, partial [Actinomycetota bacterium]|nr:hypothetical protein [Actinomycetota bacterium]
TIVSVTINDISTGVISKIFSNKFLPGTMSANYYLDVPARAIQSYLSSIPIAVKNCPSCSKSTFLEGWDCPYCGYHFTYAEMLVIEDNIRRKEISNEGCLKIFVGIFSVAIGVMFIVGFAMVEYFTIKGMIENYKSENLIIVIFFIIFLGAAAFPMYQGIKNLRRVKVLIGLLKDKNRKPLRSGNISRKDLTLIK